MTPEQPSVPPGPPPRKARDVRTVRVGDAGWEAFERIAQDRARKEGKKVTRSDVIRRALAEYAAKHDPQRRKPR